MSGHPRAVDLGTTEAALNTGRERLRGHTPAGSRTPPGQRDPQLLARFAQALRTRPDDQQETNTP